MTPTSSLRHFARAAVRVALENLLLARKVDEAKILLAKGLIEQTRQRGVLPGLHDAEFQVFSQFGDDGIIQYLARQVGDLPRSFVEFGVTDYREANTRFLLVNDNWRGLVMDCDRQNVERIRTDRIYWRHDLTAVHAFVDTGNINALLRDNGFAGPLGLLSIDIDGNDYWIWECIDAAEPVIVVAEYNALYGARRAVTVPYDPAFDRRRAHFSGLVWGCSLRALVSLAERKGFAFVGCNSNGNNAYFVRRDRLGALRALSAEEGFEPGLFREARDRRGRLTFAGPAARRATVADVRVWDLDANALVRIGDLDTTIPADVTAGGRPPP